MDDELQELDELFKRKGKLISRNNYLELSKVCNRLGEILSYSGRYNEALVEHQAEEAACVAANDDIGVAVANRKIGECYAELGDFDEALIHQNKHLELACEIHNEVEEQRALATIGRTHLYRAESLKNETKHRGANDPVFVDALNHAEESFHKSLEICSRLCFSQVGAAELDQMKGRLYHNLGMVMEHRNNTQSCIHYVEKALALHRKHNQWEDLQRCHNYLSLIYQKHDDIKKCLRQADLSLEAAAKLCNPKLQSEILILMGQAYVEEENYNSAMKALRKARKLVAEEEVDKFLRIVRRLRQLRTTVYEIESNSAENKIQMLMETFDKMGDLCVNGKMFRPAIKYYSLALNYAELQCLPAQDLAPFYVSLAQTYKDIGDYKSAAENCLLELKCREGDPEEKCRTLLNLADYREHLGAEYDTLEPLYLDALSLAKEASVHALEKECLNSLLILQEWFGKTEEKLKTQKMLRQFVNENDDTSSSDENGEESEGAATQLLDLSTQLSEESIDSGSDAEVTMDVCEVQCPRTNRLFRLRRNEKGETPLHRACIAGDSKKVKELLDQGHPVNERDYTGWLPLHEAANHGFPEIVELLLKNGARVNDRGGMSCEGITPLHDAAANGNVEVMRVLMKHGASILAKTDAGRTVMDSLIAWRRRAEDDTSPEFLAECDEMIEELKHRISQDLHSSEGKAYQSGPNLSNGASGNGINHRTLTGQSKANQNPNLVKEGNFHMLPIITPNSRCDESSSALVEDNEIFPDHEDWLIDDLGGKKQQRRDGTKRRRCDLRSWIEGSTHSRRSSDDSMCRSNSILQELFNNHDGNSVIQKSKRQRHYSSDDISDESRMSSPVTVPDSTEGVMSNTNAGMSSIQSSCFSGLRIKVNILGTLLLIPVPQGETIFWLAKEAAQRYYARTGLRPTLSLSTSDGALLSPDDAVDIVISSGEEVIGTLQSWELSSLPERYVDACKLLNEVPFRNIQQILSTAEASMSAFLTNLRLTPTNFTPIFRALQCQDTLKELNLSGNRLGIKGLQGLATAMQNLPGLRLLDVSSNDITDAAFGHLVQPLMQCNRTIMLETLNLDFNPLLENGCTNLTLLLRCLPNLTSLSVCSVCTELSSTFQRPYLSEALSVINKLHQLNLSFNCMPIEQLEELLSTLPVSNLLCLNLSATTTCVTYAIRMCTQLTKVLQSQSCILKELYLSYCALDDRSIFALLEGLSERSNMEHLDLSGNPALTARSTDAVSKVMPLTRVKITSYANVNKNGSGLDSGRLDVTSRMSGFYVLFPPSS